MSNDIIDIKKIDITNQAEVLEAAGVIIDYDLFVEAYLLLKKLGDLRAPSLEEGDRGRFLEDISASESTDNANRSSRRKPLPYPPLKGEGTLARGIIEPLVSKLKWIALPKFSEDEIVKMFGESFTTIFELPDYNLWGKIKQKIIADIWYEDRDNFKKAIGKALLKNTERLTSQNIIINGKEEHPTVENWLRDYNVNLGFAPVDKVKQSEYLTNSGNMKRIKNLELGIKNGEGGGDRIKNPSNSVGRQELRIKNGGEGKEGIEGKDGEEGMKLSEKDRLKILFNFYEKLKLSSLTAEGLEEDIFIDEDGVRGVLSGGVFEKIDPKVEQRLAELQGIIDRATSIKQENNKTTKQWEQEREKQKLEIRNSKLGGEGKLEIEKLRQGENTKEQAKRAYIFSLDEQTLIKDHENDIKRIARGNIILVGKELTRAMEQKNRTRVIAALRIAVKNNLLIGWAGKNQTDKHGLKTDEDGSRIKKGSDPFGGGQTPSAALISFLRKVLQDKLGLNEHEAAKIGVHIYNLFRKLGRDVGYLAYYDEQTSKFCWIAKDGGGE